MNFYPFFCAWMYFLLRFVCFVGKSFLLDFQSHHCQYSPFIILHLNCANIKHIFWKYFIRFCLWISFPFYRSKHSEQLFFFLWRFIAMGIWTILKTPFYVAHELCLMFCVNCEWVFLTYCTYVLLLFSSIHMFKYKCSNKIKGSILKCIWFI